MEIKRGDIWIVKITDSTGSEQSGTRPAIVVSNNYANEHSPVIEVVFLTGQNKKKLPTHIETHKGVAICEQIQSVDKSRLVVFRGNCNENEMMHINRAMMISLGIIA